MYSIEKNIVKNLAVSEEVANIAVPTSRIVCTIRKYISNARIWAYSCCTSISYRRGLLAQEGGTSSFYTHTLTKFLTNKCQQASKICRRVIVPVQRQNESSHSRILFGKCVLSPYLPERNSTKYHSARMCAATRGLWARLGWNTCILSKPCTRSSRWDLPLQMSRTAITRYSSMPAPSKSANFRIFGPICSVLA